MKMPVSFYSGTVRHPIMDPQVSDAGRRYQMVEQNFGKVQRSFFQALSRVRPDGRSMFGSTPCTIVQDERGVRWVDLGQESNGCRHYVTAGEDGSVTLRRVDGRSMRQMTMIPVPPGYQMLESEVFPNGSGQSSSYGLTPWGAVEGR
jgi:hypothetical protein